MKHVKTVSVAKKSEKAVFTVVKALCGWWKPVYVRERPDHAVLTTEEVL